MLEISNSNKSTQQTTEVDSDGFFADDPDQPFSAGFDYRGVSANESKAYVKNKLEHKKMLNDLKHFKFETHYNCIGLKKMRTNIAHSVESIDVSTGHAFGNERDALEFFCSARSMLSRKSAPPG